MPSADAASWIQAGGVVAFASAVLWELRSQRPVLQSIKEVLAALLERERIRGERRRDPSVQNVRPPTWSDGETTDLADLVDMQRKYKGKRKTPPMGVRHPRAGSHHDDVGE